MYGVAALFVVLDLAFAPQLLDQPGAQDLWFFRCTYCVPPDRAIFQRIGTGWKGYDPDDMEARVLRAADDSSTYEVEYFEYIKASGYLTPSRVLRQGTFRIWPYEGIPPTAQVETELRNQLADRLVAHGANSPRATYLSGRAARLRTAPWSTIQTVWYAIVNDSVCVLLAIVGALSFTAAGLRQGWVLLNERRMLKGHCGCCGYDLHGLSTGSGLPMVCPECGVQGPTVG